MAVTVHLSAEAALNGFPQGPYLFQGRNALHRRWLEGLHGYFLETP